MKKIFLTFLPVFFVLNHIMALDTLKVCRQSHPNTMTFSSQFFDMFCTGGITIIRKASFAGDTFGFLSNTFPAGTEGVMNVYCSGNTSVIDTSLYVMVAGRPKICFITSDSLNHPVIFVDSGSLYAHTSFSLKREVTVNVWQTVLTFLATDTLVITDTTVNSATQAFNYKIEANDFLCNDTVITTLHLQSNGSNLSWNAGGGLNLRGYYIYKYNSGIAGFVLIDSTANLTYTDLNYQSGDEYYVGAYKDDGCYSNSWRSTPSQVLVKSNRLKIGTSGVTEINQNPVRYYTVANTLYVELKNAENISLYDVAGCRLMHRYADKMTLELQPGVYVMNVANKGYKILIANP